MRVNLAMAAPPSQVINGFQSSGSTAVQTLLVLLQSRSSIVVIKKEGRSALKQNGRQIEKIFKQINSY